MKKIMILAAAVVIAASVFAKDIKSVTVTTDPVMHCQNCEKKIKNYFRFEKGVKNIETDVPGQRVKITYDADKTTEKHLLDCFSKIDYNVKVIAPADSVK